MKLITSERGEHKGDVKELREFYTHRTERLEDELKEAERVTPHQVGKYHTDEVQFAAEGLNRLADIAERKKPVEIIIRELQRGGEEQPPERKKMGESRILEHVPSEYTE